MNGKSIILVLLLLCLNLSFLLFSCSTDIEPTNIYDPEAPSTLQAKGTISGRILFDEKDMFYSERIMTIWLKDTSYNTRAESDGSFILNDIPAGTYVIKIKSDDAEYIEKEVGPQNVGIGEKKYLGEIQMRLKKGNLRGFVKTRGLDGKTYTGVGGAGIFLVSERVSNLPKLYLNSSSDRCGHIQSNLITMSSISGPDGSFVFNDVPVGRYFIRSVDRLLGLGGSDNIEVKYSVTTDVPDLEIVPPSSLIHIEDADQSGKSIRVTGKGVINVVYLTAGFINEYKLAIDKIPEDENQWEMIESGGSKVLDISSLSEGPHKVYIKFRDIICRESPVYDAEFFVDRTAPEIEEIKIDGLNDGYTAVPNLRVRLSASDNYHTEFLSDFSGIKMRKVVINKEDIDDNLSQNALNDYLNKNQVSFDEISGDFSISTGSGDGGKLLLIQLQDEAGNQSEVYISEFIYDSKKPLFDFEIVNAINESGVLYTNSNFLTINIIGDPDIAQIKIFTSEETEPLFWENFVNPLKFTLDSSEGQKTVKIRARDKAGNESELVSKDIILDLSPPKLKSITINNGKPNTNNRSIPIDIDGDDISSMIVDEYSDSTNWMPFLTHLDFDLKGGDGIHSIYFKFKDKAGNIIGEYESIKKDIVLDTIKPGMVSNTIINGSLASATEPVYTNSNIINLSWESQDSDISYFKIELYDDNNSQLIQTYLSKSAQYTIPSLGDGRFYVKIIAVDLADNSGDATDAIRFIVDTIPPNAPRVVQPAFTKINLNEQYCGGVVSLLEIPISVESSDENFLRYEIRGVVDPLSCSTLNDFQDASPFIYYGQSSKILKIYLSKDAVNNVHFRAIDMAGNKSDYDFIWIIEDSTPPDKVTSITGENANGKVLIKWKPPQANSSDVKGYKIYYGYNSNSFSGDFSDKGPSPLDAGNPCIVVDNEAQCYFWLTGLPNNAQFYVNISAYDDTQLPGSNEGMLSDSSLKMMAAEVTPDPIGEISLQDIKQRSGAVFESVVVRDGILYATVSNSSGDGGLYLLDVAYPDAPKVIGFITNAYFKYMYGVRLYGKYAFIPDGENGVHIIDVSQMKNPQKIRTIVLPANEHAVSVDVYDRFLFVAANSEGISNGKVLYVYNIGDINNPVLKLSYMPYPITLNYPTDIKVEGEIAVLSFDNLSSSDKRILKITYNNDDINFTEISEEPQGYFTQTLLSYDSMFATGYGEIRFFKYKGAVYELITSTSVFDIYSIGISSKGPYVYVRTDKNLKIIKRIENEFLSVNYVEVLGDGYLPVSPRKSVPMSSFYVYNNTLFVSYFSKETNSTGIKIYNLANPRIPQSIGQSSITVEGGYDIDLYKEKILLANGSGGFYIAEVVGNTSIQEFFSDYSAGSCIKVYNFDNFVYAIKSNNVLRYSFRVDDQNNQKVRVDNLYTSVSGEIIDAIVDWPYLIVGLKTEIGKENVINKIDIVSLIDNQVKATIPINTSQWPNFRSSNLLGLSGNKLFLAYPDNNIKLYDISVLSNIVEKDIPGTLNLGSISISGQYLFYSWMYKIMVLNIDTYVPEKEVFAGYGGGPQDIIPLGGMIGVGTSSGEIDIYSLKNNPQLYSRYAFDGRYNRIVATGNILYSSNYMSQLIILSLE